MRKVLYKFLLIILTFCAPFSAHAVYPLYYYGDVHVEYLGGPLYNCDIQMLFISSNEVVLDILPKSFTMCEYIEFENMPYLYDNNVYYGIDINFVEIFSPFWPGNCYGMIYGNYDAFSGINFFFLGGSCYMSGFVDLL